MAGIINDDIFGENVLVGTLTPSNPYDISVEKSVAGLIGESIQNISVNAAAGVNLQLIVEPATADAFTLCNVNGAATYSAGIDNSDSDSYKITTGASPSAGTTAINITTAGVVTLPGGALDVPSGGTGVVSNTAYAVLCGGTVAAGPIQSIVSVGNAGEILTSNGAGALPTFQAGGTGDVTAAANLTDNAVIRGDGGVKGVQTSTILISDAGEMTNPSQPAFAAYLSSTQSNVTGDSTTYTIIPDTEIFDQNSDYNNATGTFTAPVTGKYNFSCACYITGGTSINGANFTLVTSNRTWRADFPIAAQTTEDILLTALVDMDSADIANIQIVATDTGGKVDDVFGAASPFTWFTGNLVC